MYFWVLFVVVPSPRFVDSRNLGRANSLLLPNYSSFFAVPKIYCLWFYTKLNTNLAVIKHKHSSSVVISTGHSYC